VINDEQSSFITHHWGIEMVSARIFIIWNNEVMINLFAYALEQTGYITQSAYSYEDGFAACVRQPPDLLVIPRFIVQQDDGLDFCRQVRGTPPLSRVPIIVGYADLARNRVKWEEAYQQAYEAGANACFGRVFDIGDVLEQITILLANPAVTNLVERQRRPRPSK
jgi:CheY-like chemotaxis protein